MPPAMQITSSHPVGTFLLISASIPRVTRRLTGVGDSFFQGTVRIIAFGLGISLAQQGSILGPILAIILSFIPAWFVTWY